TDAIDWIGLGSCPISGSAMPRITAVRPRLPSASVYSDQPTRPSSVVTFRNENVRHPASQCRSSIRAILITILRPGLSRDLTVAPITASATRRMASHRRRERASGKGMEPFFLSLSRALAQLGDRSFLGVLLRSLAWSAAIFAGLQVAVVWLVDKWLNLHGLLGWAADLLGSIGASILTLWLFLPVAAAIGTLYFDRIAHAVEQRYYPGLPPPAAAPMIEQIWDGVALGLRILLLNLVALLLAILLPGVGLMLGWAVAAYAIGRGLFVAVAMRRMSRAAAESQYAHARIVVLLLGGLMALAACVPLLNLLIPVVGTAAMVHLLDLVLTRQTEPYSVRNQF